MADNTTLLFQTKSTNNRSNERQSADLAIGGLQ